LERRGIGVSIPHPDLLASWESGGNRDGGAGREKVKGGE